METIEIAVILGGAGLIALVLWFFFGAREATQATAGSSSGAVQEVEVRVKGGYSPDRIAVVQGQPLRLLFRREETSSCTEDVVFGDFGITRNLPVGKTVPVEFTPTRAGEFTFTCGMNMVRGRLLVKQNGDGSHGPDR